MAENPIQLKEGDKRQKSLKLKLVELYRKKIQIKKLEAEYKSMKENVDDEVKTYMANAGSDSLHFSFKQQVPEAPGSKYDIMVDKNVRIMNVVRKKVIFDPDALEERFGKEFCRDFISRKYEIVDWDGMVKLLKSKGVKPNEFLPFINVEKKVDNSKIDQMESVGDIKREELEGTYKVLELSNYLQMDEFSPRK